MDQVRSNVPDFKKDIAGQVLLNVRGPTDGIVIQQLVGKEATDCPRFVERPSECRLAASIRREMGCEGGAGRQIIVSCGHHLRLLAVTGGDGNMKADGVIEDAHSASH